jgi:hypothetical protein
MSRAQQQKPVLMQQRSVGRRAGQMVSRAASITVTIALDEMRACDSGASLFAVRANGARGVFHAVTDCILHAVN